MNVDFWDAAILDPLRRLAQDALAFLLNNFLAMVVVLVIGFLAAALLRFLVGMTLRLARFDRFCERHGVTSALRAAGIERVPSQATARLAYWLVMFVLLSLAALNIPAVNDLVSRFFVFLPNVLAAVVILVLGYLAAAFLQRAT